MRSAQLIRNCAAGAAVVLAAGTSAQADYVYTGPTGGSWFTGASWTDTLPDPNTTGTLPNDTQTTNINNGVNGGGVIFDPVADGQPTTVNIARLYISSNNSGPGSIDPEFAGQTLQPNFLTINSGTLNTGPTNQLHIGRHADGTLNMNGGTLTAFDFRMTDGSATTATLNYTGGTMTIGERIRMGRGADSTTVFNVGNSAGGRITVGLALGNDFVMAEAAGADATVAFHYQNGGVQTIEVGDELSLRNGADPVADSRSARLGLVLDEAPTLVGNAPEDLALFAITSDKGTTSNVSGGIAEFRNLANTDYYSEGDIISAMFGGVTYEWAITYEGSVLVDVDGNVTGITGAGTGADVVLIGQPVPEPGGLALLGAGALALLRRTRRAAH